MFPPSSLHRPPLFGGASVLASRALGSRFGEFGLYARFQFSAFCFQNFNFGFYLLSVLLNVRGSPEPERRHPAGLRRAITRDGQIEEDVFSLQVGTVRCAVRVLVVDGALRRPLSGASPSSAGQLSPSP